MCAVSVPGAGGGRFTHTIIRLEPHRELVSWGKRAAACKLTGRMKSAPLSLRIKFDWSLSSSKRKGIEYKLICSQSVSCVIRSKSKKRKSSILMKSLI